MLQVIGLNNRELWDDIVCSFKRYDVYYLSGYVKAFQLHGDGEPFLLYYEVGTLKAIYVFMLRETSIEGVYDSITPYGYGGVMFEGDVCIDNINQFWCDFVQKMKELNIVDGFIRYHPILKNAQIMSRVSNVIELGRTVAMDLTSPEIIWGNISSKNRNMIRKAEKNGVEIHHSKDKCLFEDFIRIYNLTMDKDHATDYYYFNKDFYDSIYCDLSDNYELFYATYNGVIIAMSIILFANEQMHYHLSGSLGEYRYLAPSNLLLYKAALWGCDKGFKTFHMGGGIGSGEDNLYKFKAAFNKNTDCQFSIGKEIYNQELYDKLVMIRASKTPEFNNDSNYFPLYRA